MTKEEFDQLGRTYGLFTYGDGNILFLKPQYMWVDVPVMTFEQGKVHIRIKLDENGDLYRYETDRIIVSEVATARFFLNEMMKQRKQILENKNLRKFKKISSFVNKNLQKI